MILLDLYIASIYKLSKNKFIHNPCNKVRDLLLLIFFYLNLTLIFTPILVLIYFKTLTYRCYLIPLFVVAYIFIYVILYKKIRNYITDDLIKNSCNKIVVMNFLIYIFYFIFTLIFYGITPFFTIWIYTLVK